MLGAVSGAKMPTDMRAYDEFTFLMFSCSAELSQASDSGLGARHRKQQRLLRALFTQRCPATTTRPIHTAMGRPSGGASPIQCGFLVHDACVIDVAAPLSPLICDADSELVATGTGDA